MSGIERFRRAQDSSFAGYESALQELRAGGKSGHWIWYVFPQISGLGNSAASRNYAIDNETEAAEFLRDDQLRSRLLTIASVVGDQLSGGPIFSLSDLMGSEIDALKLVSSLTLFGHVAQRLAETEHRNVYTPILRVADRVLKLAAAQGYPPCAYTLQRLRVPSEH